ncbi:putative periplasmic lipoprotein [Undibacterium flavidum]|uniref:Lipoprotein n=1 Tax=Undibacterium flavidum TaxID=2762297 RepID=A0ABR6YC60_9BURK|nr:hypothetical protein [Undibacterium flavidum]MBC3874120.1 hypothetical protein [Undibacterium flavidum]
MRKILALAITSIVLSGCAANKANFSSISTKITLQIKGQVLSELPYSLDLDAKATGQYEFVSSTSDGKKMYGILPLHVNGTKMGMSIAFFAPALAIGGFRDAYGFYQFDPANNAIRYKLKEEDEWRMTQPTKLESDRARTVLEPTQ